MNSTNPNRGHYKPAPVITHPKTPTSDTRTTGQGAKPAADGKSGGSR